LPEPEPEKVTPPVIVTKPPTIDTSITAPVTVDPTPSAPSFKPTLPPVLETVDLPELEPEVQPPVVINTKPPSVDISIPVTPPSIEEPVTPVPSFKPKLPPVLDEVDLPDPEPV
jgi:hypothetical protein